MAKDFSREVVRGWENDNEVTIEFMDRVAYQIERFDQEIHETLLSGTEAAVEHAKATNARMQQLKEVLLIPEGMIKEGEDEK